MAAKKPKEKLVALLDAAAELKDNAAEAGNYSREAIDKFSSAIAEAHMIAIDESAGDELIEAAFKGLNGAIKAFKSSAIKSPEPGPEKVTLRGVVLRGPDNFKRGLHSVHVGSIVVTFVDGKAEVTPEMADALMKDGYVE